MEGSAVQVALLLDGSFPMNDASEILPTRIQGMFPHLQFFIHTLLAANPLSTISLIVMRDCVAHVICPLTNDPCLLMEALNQRYILHPGSGYASLENGLRVAMGELLSSCGQAQQSASLSSTLQKKIQDDENENDCKESTTLENEESKRLSSTVGAKERRKIAQRRVVPFVDIRPMVVCLMGSVTIVDPGDIFHVLKEVSKRCIACHVLSLFGATHVLQEITARTGGELICPLQHATVGKELLRFCQVEAAKWKEKQQQIQSVNNLHGEEEGGNEPLQRLIEIGFSDCEHTCRRCGNFLRSFESDQSTCMICGLKCIGTDKIISATLLQNRPILKESEGKSESLRCQLCHSSVGGKGQRMQCDVCHSVMCDVCSKFVMEMAFCPCCF